MDNQFSITKRTINFYLVYFVLRNINLSGLFNVDKVSVTGSYEYNMAFLEETIL